jgi:hypothetical protein
MKKLSKKSKLATGIVTFAGSQILASFGNPAFAECAGSSDSLCIETVAICIPEQTLVEVTTATYTDTFPVIVTAQQESPNYPTYAYVEEPNTDFTVNLLHDGYPEPEYYNNFDPGESGLDPTILSGPPNEGILINREFSLEYTADIPANTGPVAVGNGRESFTFSVAAEGYAWNAGLGVYEVRKTFIHDLTVLVDHINEAPQASNITTTVLNQEHDVQSGVTLSDLESNTVNIVYELSTSPAFSTITDTATYTGLALTPAGVTHTHTWQDLGPAAYYWRAAVTETDSQGSCTGYSETEVDPGIVAVSSGSTLFTVAEAPGGPTLPASGINAVLLTGVAVVMIVSACATWLYSHVSLKKA